MANVCRSTIARVRSNCEFWFQPPPAKKYAQAPNVSRKSHSATRRSARETMLGVEGWMINGKCSHTRSTFNIEHSTFNIPRPQGRTARDHRDLGGCHRLRD